MKNNILKYFLIILALGLFSCQQFKDITNVDKIQKISTTIKINAKAPSGIPHPQSYKIKLNNYTEGLEFIKETNTTECDISDIIPGIYSVTVSAEVSHNGFTYNFNGNLVNINIFNSEKKLDVSIEATKSGNIVFKEIFYSGSKTPKGGSYFRDQFYELYNNSNIIQYVDGLCIGLSEPSNATANLPSWPGENPNDYMYFASIWQIPGTPNVDKKYPLNPGESIIIAQMADNHQRNGLNPKSPVNLITAEFETLVKTTSLVLDNPAINMEIAFWPRTAPQWLTTVFGGAYGIFIPTLPINPLDFVNPINSTKKAYKVDVSNIIDAVEMVDNETKMKLKRLPALLDAGASTVGATYCSKSVSRKIKETLTNGRIIFMDTNNSSEDFEAMDTPTIRRYNVKYPSWNTWAK
ncbi:MAG: DUF4876 domain-containing protein [Bacteroidales bacterium]